MRIAVCDDERRILSDMEKKIKTLFPKSVVAAFADGGHLLEGMSAQDFDVLLLDIDMPKVNGLEIAEQLKKSAHKPLLVFVTSHDELVYDSLQYHPFGFIRKNHFDEEIGRVLRDCEKENADREQHFTFKSGAETVRISLSEILYLESDGNYLRLFTKEAEYRLRDTITAVENTLYGKGFIRLHRGFLVNQKAVRILGTEEAELITGVKVPIGRSYAEEAKKRLMEYMRR